jgi:hypothetical protein
MMSFGSRFVVAVLVALAFVGPANTQNDAQSDDSVSYYGVDFPVEIADGRRFSTRDFEPTNPGLGFSAGYRHRGAISTLYIYDAQVRSIPDDLAAPVLVAQFEQAKRDIQRAQPNSAALTSKGKFTLADAGGRPRLNCEGFGLARSGEPARDTYLCLGVANGKFFKVRTTMAQSPDSQAEIQRFIGAWAAKIWKS